MGLPEPARTAARVRRTSAWVRTYRRTVARFSAHVCPAGVYEEVDGVLRVNAPNCVDSKATDGLGPRWTPREGGAGRSATRM